MADVGSHSKLCFRRMRSISTLLSPTRHSQRCLRGKCDQLKRVRRFIVAFRTKSPSTESYFTQRIPAELRLLIYERLFQFDRPLELHQYHLRLQLRGIAILRVCRMAYKEALPVLYELNAMVAHRDDFCRFAPAKITFKTELVRDLYVCDLDSSVPCLSRPLPPEPERCDHRKERRCINCEDNLFAFLDTLKLLPRIRKICIDYCRHSRCVHALSKSLGGPGSSRSDLQMTCVGVGNYRLEGPWVGTLDFELRDTMLSSGWEKTSSHDQRDLGLIDLYRTNRQCLSKLDNVRRRHGYSYFAAIDYISNLATLFAIHDEGRIPANFARIWPSDLSMDFRLISQFRKSEFLHEFNVQLQLLLDYGQWESLIPRRMN